MERRKILLLDEKTERAIATVCDTALKFAGMHMASIVADVAAAIQDKNLDFSDEDW